ncbi:MAG: M3 family metallopeptidase, partial [Clostridia bacterium]
MAKLLERKNVKEKYKWDLTRLVNGDEEWNKKLEAISKKIGVLGEYQGKLSNDDELLKYLKANDKISVELLKLYLYANMNSHVDMRVNKYQEMCSKIQMLIVNLSTLTSYVVPEICKRSEDELIALSKNSTFSDYSYMFEKLAINKQHVLSEKEEKLLAEISSFTSDFKDIFEMFDSAEVRFENVKVGDEVFEMSNGMYGVLLQNPNQEIRKAGFESMFNAYKNYINTIANIYGGSVKKDWVLSKIRGFKSSLEGELNDTNVDPQAYKNLINSVNNNCKYMHQYMAFRKDALHLETLNMWD